MDRILYKEVNGDITCRSRDFEKIFPTLYAYEETGLTPDEIKELIANHNALVDELLAKLEQAIKERDAAIAAIFKIAERGTTWMCPYCKNAQRIYGGVCECALGIGVCRNPFTKFEWRGEKLEDSYYG
jgi:hypothetical protein